MGGREEALAALHQAGVPGDAEYPRPHMLGLAELVEILEDLQQRILRDFLGILLPAAHQPAVMEDLGSKMIDESLKSAGFTVEHGTRQLGLTGPVHALILTR
jgi:hypothetical protein